MIEKHISELLKTNDRVIIPNFGAFLKSKGEVKSIIFNEFIKFNDGQLIQAIAEKEKISIEEASGKLDEFVDKIKSTLDKGSKFPIEGVGVLYPDEKGRLRFESEEVNSPGGEEKKEEKKEETKDEKKEKVDEKKEVKKDEKRETSKKKTEKPEEKKPSEKKEEKVPEEKESKPRSKFPTPVREYQKEKPAEEKKKTEKTTESAKTEEKKKEKIKQQDPRKTGKDEEEKPRYLAVWIIIALIVVAIIVWLVLDWNNIPGYFKHEAKQDRQEQLDKQTPQQKKEQPDKKVVKKEETAKKAEKSQPQKPAQETTAKKESTQQTEKPAEPAKTDVSGPAKKYHLIAGVFSEEKNADEMVIQLRKDGFYPEKIGRINDLYYVTYNSFEKKQDANYELKRLYDKGLDVWLYFY